MIKEAAFLLVVLVVTILFVKLFFDTILFIAEKNKFKEISKKYIVATRTPAYMFFPLLAVFLTAETFNLAWQYHSLISSAFYTLFILGCALLLSRYVSIIVMRRARSRNQLQKAPHLINGLIYVGIYIISAFLLLDYFQVEITPFLATLGIGGLAVGLALQTTLSNFFAGVHIISDRGIRVGDFIEIDETAGWVEDVGSISTRIRTLHNTMLVVPNSKVMSSIVMNDSLPLQELNLWCKCGVAYTQDLYRVESVALEVAKQVQQEVPEAVKDFEPLFRYTEFGDSNINFRVVLRAKSYPERFIVNHEFIKRLKKRFDEEGIEISWPVRKIVNSQ